MARIYPADDLTLAEQDQFFAVIETSIVDRYSGDLERCEDGAYIALDTDAIRELLTTNWGTLVSAETIECVYTTLVEDGVEQWPLGWCEEDIEREREQRLPALDYEIECAEDRLAKLKNERDQLAGHYARGPAD
jgi:hypothetical protein